MNVVSLKGVDICTHEIITMVKMINISLTPQSFSKPFCNLSLQDLSVPYARIPRPGNHWFAFCSYRFFFFLHFLEEYINLHKWNHRVCVESYSMCDFCVFFHLVELLCNLFMSLPVSIIYSFSLRNNIPWYWYTTICISIHLITYLCCFQVLTLTKNLLQTFV